MLGAQRYGQLGLGNATHMGDDPNEMGSNLPFVQLGANRTATEIAVGEYHACALLDDGSVKCWGYNGYGQLGLGNTTQIGDGEGDFGG